MMTPDAEDLFFSPLCWIAVITVGVLSLVGGIVISTASDSEKISKLKNDVQLLQGALAQKRTGGEFQRLQGDDAFFGSKRAYNYFSIDRGKTWYVEGCKATQVNKSQWHVDHEGVVGKADPRHTHYLLARREATRCLESQLGEGFDATQLLSHIENLATARQAEHGVLPKEPFVLTPALELPKGDTLAGIPDEDLVEPMSSCSGVLPDPK